jgi:hypothetical protein
MSNLSPKDKEEQLKKYNFLVVFEEFINSPAGEYFVENYIDKEIKELVKNTRNKADKYSFQEVFGVVDKANNSVAKMAEWNCKKQALVDLKNKITSDKVLEGIETLREQLDL